MNKARTVGLFALSIMTALALPAFASAAEWTREGEPLEEPQVIGLEGTYGHFTAFGSFKCPVQGEATLLPGDQGEITELQVTGPCQGSVFNCKVEPVLETPWQMEAQPSGNIFISEAKENWVFPECIFAPPVEGSIELTPNNSGAMSSLIISGTMEETVTGFPVPPNGELKVTPAGIYGVS
jgi:hypothetical protein